ncbi:MAG: hypothetical protein ACFCU8_21680 [Thermosynechococcaceae cyanobacterium]
MGIQPELSHKYQRRQCEAGFALPVAIGLGLIMLLLGVTMIVRSQNDQVNASAQKATAESLAAAEVGVSKVQAFLNLYRVLATVPNAGSPSWANRAGVDINNIVNASCNAGNVANDLSTLYPNGSGDWPNVDPNDAANPPAQGEFRTVGYTFDAASSRGTLTVQGRVNAGQPGESVAQVQVEIPVQPISQAAALWVRGSISGSNPTINGTVITPCLAPIPSAANNIRTNQVMPAVPTAPSAAPADFTQPLGDSNPDDDVITQYSTTSAALSAGKPLKILSGSNVEIWVNDSNQIDWQGQKIKCIMSGAYGVACNPADTFKVTIYAIGTSQLLLDSQSVLCNIHFHGPDYSVNISDAGNPVEDCGVLNTNGDKVHLNGSFWVNNWTDNTDKIALDQSTAANVVTLPPQLAPISRWERQEVVVSP